MSVNVLGNKSNDFENGVTLVYALAALNAFFQREKSAEETSKLTKA